MTTLHRVSSRQVAIAHAILSGVEAFNRRDWDCHANTWPGVCHRCALVRLDADRAKATQASREWAARVLEHVKHRKPLRGDPSAKAYTRKLKRAEKAGLMPQKATTCPRDNPHLSHW